MINFRPAAVLATMTLGAVLSVQATTPITTCDNAILSKDRETYVLQNDCAAPGTAFIVAADDVTLDLGGHIVTYGNANFVEVPNHGFEDCSSGVPAGWDLSLAPGATCRPREKYVGNYELVIPMSGAAKTLRSQPVTLPPGKTFFAFGWVLGKESDSATLRVVDVASGTVLASYASRGGLHRGFALCDPYEGLKIPKTVVSRQVRLEVEIAATTGDVVLDEIDIKPGMDYGVVANNWTDDRYVPDVPPGSVRRGARFTLKNGTLRQGGGLGVFSSPVRISGVRPVIESLRTNVVGHQTKNLIVTSDDGASILKNSLNSQSSMVFNRMHGVSEIALTACGKVSLQGNTVTGGPQFGISYSRPTACTPPDEELIEQNVIRTTGAVTNCYAISGGNWRNMIIRNNTLAPTLGRGIIFGADTNQTIENVSIYDNFIEVNEKPNYEYGPRSLQAAGIRIRTYGTGSVQNIKIFRNIIRAWTDAERDSEANGITINSQGGRDTIEIFGNYIKTWSLHNPYTSYGVLFQDTNMVNGGSIVVRDNTIMSNSSPARLGNSDGFSTASVRFERNHFKKGPEAWGSGGNVFHTVRYGYNPGVQNQNLFADNRYGTGTGVNDFQHEGGSSDNYLVAWRASATVTGSNGEPVENATVWAVDTTGVERARGLTNRAGRVDLVVPQYSRSGVGLTSSRTLTPYTFRAAVGSDSVASPPTGVTSNTKVSLRLTATPGSAIAGGCGNGVIDTGEQCDGLDLDWRNCQDHGWDYGVLGCTSSCQYEFGGCRRLGDAGGSGPPSVSGSRRSDVKN
ncbi:MAG: carboxypeptidase-like regulatory domain-containing protein [Acidobacteria bacterium]|jgi:hypothetical protein|nr:carboxypeptidase-like regulatory domain-containing protein [Acidobacteriota bacterium]